MITSIHNIKQKKCWSCKNYLTSREFKKNFFGTNNVKIEDKALCAEHKSNNKDGTTLYSWYCAHYKRSSDVETIIKYEEKIKSKESDSKDFSKNIDENKSLINKYALTEVKKIENKVKYERKIKRLEKIPSVIKILTIIINIVYVLICVIVYADMQSKISYNKLMYDLYKRNETKMSEYLEIIKTLEKNANIFLVMSLVILFVMILASILLIKYIKNNKEIKKSIQYCKNKISELDL